MTEALTDPQRRTGAYGPGQDTIWCPLSFEVEPIARFLNAELPTHPVYDGFELQWFDDDVHGTGMLAFLSRRDDRRVDYYVQPGLRLDRSGYEIGGGIGAWVDTAFEVARLEVTPDGVDAEVDFADQQGRRIEVRIDDRAAGPRREGLVLAPVGSSVEHPVSLFLVHLHGFELVRRGGPDPVIRIDGEDVDTGRLPGAALHRRHLVKYAAPLTVGTVCRDVTGPLEPLDASGPNDPSARTRAEFSLDGRAVSALAASVGGARGRLDLDPPLPSLTDLQEGRTEGAWWVSLDGHVVTGGQWWADRDGCTVELGLDVTRRWRPKPGLPALMRIVTRVVPVFRRWPTTYRWRATVTLGGVAAAPTMLSQWERVGQDRGDSYRRATS